MSDAHERPAVKSQWLKTNMNTITFQNVKQTSSTAVFKLGQRGTTPDGREWVYVKASAAVGAGHAAVPAATTSVGTTISSSQDALARNVYITKASAGWTVGAFEDGYVHIDGGTGSGQVAKIKSNTVDTLELYPEDALATALSTDSTMEIWTQFLIRKNQLTSKVQNATGIAQVAFASADYGWVLTRGVGVVIGEDVLVAGKSFVTGPATTVGEVMKGTTAKGGFDEQILGVCINANSAADLGALVFVTLS